MDQLEPAVAVAILLGLALGILVGMWQGYWVAYVGIPAFIVTLAGMLLFRGLDLMILDAQSIPVPEAFQKIANGYLPDMGPNTGYHNPTLVLTLAAASAVVTSFELRSRADREKYDMSVPSIAIGVFKLVLVSGAVLAAGMLLASYKGVPVVGLILFALVGALQFITRKTVPGRYIYSVGGNSGAARAVRRQHQAGRLPGHGQHGPARGVAGMVFTAYLNAANPKDGIGFELDAIAAVFIGGAAVAGGVGTVSGSMIGGLVMGVLNLGLANLSVDSNFVQIIKGLVLLVAVAFDVLVQGPGRPSFIGMMLSGAQPQGASHRRHPPRSSSRRPARTGAPPACGADRAGRRCPATWTRSARPAPRTPRADPAPALTPVALSQSATGPPGAVRAPGQAGR